MNLLTKFRLSGLLNNGIFREFKIRNSLIINKIMITKTVNLPIIQQLKEMRTNEACYRFVAYLSKVT